MCRAAPGGDGIPCTRRAQVLFPSVTLPCLACACAEDREAVFNSMGAAAPSSSASQLATVLGASGEVRSAAASQQAATQGGRLDNALVALAAALAGGGAERGSMHVIRTAPCSMHACDTHCVQPCSMHACMPLDLIHLLATHSAGCLFFSMDRVSCMGCMQGPTPPTA